MTSHPHSQHHTNQEIEEHKDAAKSPDKSKEDKISKEQYERLKDQLKSHVRYKAFERDFKKKERIMKENMLAEIITGPTEEIQTDIKEGHAKEQY